MNKAPTPGEKHELQLIPHSVAQAIFFSEYLRWFTEKVLLDLAALDFKLMERQDIHFTEIKFIFALLSKFYFLNSTEENLKACKCFNS